MKKHLIMLGFAVCLAMLAGPTAQFFFLARHAGAQATLTGRPYIIDGDTIAIGETHIRRFDFGLAEGQR
jgi:hypothetical protein